MTNPGICKKEGHKMINYNGNKAENVKIAYIGGGSRGWAWKLMTDLAMADDISGEIALYDIDYDASKKNEIIGNRIKDMKECKSVWTYKASKTIDEALAGANFVVISILPATFDEMQSDVHTPEEYNIYQAVGDTTGPGGIIRALRTIPMYETIAKVIEKNCPDAWVISYTNPMAVCVSTLYKVFPKIKAFGCCHEVFGTQKLLAKMLGEMCGIENINREEIITNVVGVNHFTWLTSAQYRNIDLFPLYKEFCQKYAEDGYKNGTDDNWMNNAFQCEEMVKMDLFLRHGYIAAAGDRHLAEFCNQKWYLESPERVAEMHFGLTNVDYRKKDRIKKVEKSERMVSGEDAFEFSNSGEDGVNQIRALLGLHSFVTNINIPNVGQIPNLPKGVIVESNATFRANSATPVFAGDVPFELYPMIAKLAGEQELTVRAGLERNFDLAFQAFVQDPLCSNLSLSEAKKLFDKMIDNTKEYLW